MKMPWGWGPANPGRPQPLGREGGRTSWTGAQRTERGVCGETARNEAGGLVRD